MEALCDAIGEGPQQLPALLGLVAYYAARGDTRRQREFGRATLRMAEQLAIPPLRAVGHVLLARDEMVLGQMEAAARHTREVVTLEAQGALPTPVAAFDLDMSAIAHYSEAGILLATGKVDRSLDALARMIERAEAAGHAHTRAFCYALGALFKVAIPQVDGTRALAEVGLAISRERGFRQLEPIATVALGWVQTREGDPGGAALCDRGVEEMIATGSQGGLSMLCVAAGDAHAEVGNFARAGALADLGLEYLERTGEIIFSSSLLVLRGRAHAGADGRDLDAAERAFEEAVALARRCDYVLSEMQAWTQQALLARRRTGRISEQARSALSESLARIEGSDLLAARLAREVLAG